MVHPLCDYEARAEEEEGRQEEYQETCSPRSKAASTTIKTTPIPLNWIATICRILVMIWDPLASKGIPVHQSNMMC